MQITKEESNLEAKNGEYMKLKKELMKLTGFSDFIRVLDGGPANETKYKLIEERNIFYKEEVKNMWDKIQTFDNQIQKNNHELQNFSSLIFILIRNYFIFYFILIIDLEKDYQKYKEDKKILKEKIRKLEKEIIEKDEELSILKIENEERGIGSLLNNPKNNEFQQANFSRELLSSLNEYQKKLILDTNFVNN